jgi:hypothetical protein
LASSCAVFNSASLFQRGVVLLMCIITDGVPVHTRCCHHGTLQETTDGESVTDSDLRTVS